MASELVNTISTSRQILSDSPNNFRLDTVVISSPPFSSMNNCHKWNRRWTLKWEFAEWSQLVPTVSDWTAWNLTNLRGIWVLFCRSSIDRSIDWVGVVDSASLNPRFSLFTYSLTPVGAESERTKEGVCQLDQLVPKKDVGYVVLYLPSSGALIEIEKSLTFSLKEMWISSCSTWKRPLDLEITR